MSTQNPSLLMHLLFDKIVSRSTQIQTLHEPNIEDFSAAVSKAVESRTVAIAAQPKQHQQRKIFVCIGHDIALGMLGYLSFPLVTELRQVFDELQSVADRANGYLGNLYGVTVLSDVDLLRSTKPQSLETLRKRAIYVVDADPTLSEVYSAVHFVCNV